MDVNTQPFEMQYGDVVMLCSDGITKTLSDEQIHGIIVSDIVSMEDKAKTLVNAAITGNTHSQDNTSVAILQYKESIINKRKDKHKRLAKGPAKENGQAKGKRDEFKFEILRNFKGLTEKWGDAKFLGRTNFLEK